jgi:hypothetical protein
MTKALFAASLIQLAKWNALKEKELPTLNVLLQQRQLPTIVVRD